MLQAQMLYSLATLMVMEQIGVVNPSLGQYCKVIITCRFLVEVQTKKAKPIPQTTVLAWRE